MDLLFFFVDVEHLAFFGELFKVRILAAELVEERSGCNDCRKFGLVDTADKRIDGGCVVQVDCSLSAAENGHDAKGRVAACGEHEAHVLVVLGERLDLFAEVVAEADHLVTVHMATGGVNQNRAGTALAHCTVPERNDACGMVHCHVPDVGTQILQVFADDIFGCGGGHGLAEAHADDPVKILRTVHAFGGVAVTAAPETLDVERN